MSLLWYVGNEHPRGAVRFDARPSKRQAFGALATATISGSTPETGLFSMRFVEHSNASTATFGAYAAPYDKLDELPNPNKVYWSALHKDTDDLWSIKGGAS